MVKDANESGGSGLWLLAGKVWFLGAAYAVTVALTHLVPADVYGLYIVVARLIAVPNMVLIYAVLFMVSRPLAAEFSQGCPSYDVLRARGFKIAAVLGGVISLGLVAAAPAVARWQHAPELTLPLRIVAPISLIYALHAINVGTLNAVRRFRRQAFADIFMATAKAGLTITAAVLGLSLAAMVGGFTTASLLALIVSGALAVGVAPVLASGRTATSGGATAGMTAFAGVLVVFTAAVNLLQSADLLILSSFAASAEQEFAVGFYSSAMQVALIPFSLLNAVILFVFPLVASIDATKEPDRLRNYLCKTAEISLALLVFMSAVASAAASEVQGLLFPAAYGAASQELKFLVWGFSGYAFATTVAWIFNSAKRSKIALGVVGLPLVAVVVGSYVLVPRWFTTGAAVAVACAGALAVATALIALYRTFGATVSVKSVLKLALAVVAVEIVARGWSAAGVLNDGKLGMLLKLAALSVTFVAVAWTTRVVTPARIRELRRA